MGRFKTDADQTSKRLIKTRVESLEKKVRLLDAVTANLVREVGAKAALASALAQQPGAVVTSPAGDASAEGVAT